MRPFGEAQTKAMKAYPQSGQYYTIVESRVHLTRRWTTRMKEEERLKNSIEWEMR